MPILAFMVDSINANISDLNRFISFCQTHSYIGRFMNYTGASSASPALTAYERLSDEYRQSPVNSYIHRIIIGNSYDKYLQIVDRHTRHHKMSPSSQKHSDIYDSAVKLTRPRFYNRIYSRPIYRPHIRECAYSHPSYSLSIQLQTRRICGNIFIRGLFYCSDALLLHR